MLIRMVLSVVLTILGGTILGFVLLVLGFQVGLLTRIDILFYRGLAIIALAMPIIFAALFVVLKRRQPLELALRDALSAAIVSAALNLSFLIVVPVTVDRSISIFMLGQMANSPEDLVTPKSMRDRFTRVYVEEGHQIERRLHEQTVSGNIAAEPDGYRLTARGRFVVAVSRVVAELFDSRAGILSSPMAPSPPPRH